MKDCFNNVYLDLINEAKYNNSYWIRINVYKGIEIYIRRDKHLFNRLNERYTTLSTTNVIRIIQRFIKEENNKKENSIFNKNLNNNPEISYTIFGLLTEIYISGRFKANSGIWRCYISTVLPSNNTYYSKNDYYAEVYA